MYVCVCACEVFVLFKLHAFVSISVFSHPNLRRGGEGAGQWMKYYRCNFSWVVVMFLVCLFVGE